MARKQTFMLVSLEEDKAKRLAQVLSNDTSRKILDALAEGKKTLSQLSKELAVPLPTMHYNMKALQDAGLVTSKEFNYSAKGREMQHYELVNKYVIIAPAAAKEGIKEKLKALLPTLVTIGGIGLAYQFLRGNLARTMKVGAPMAEKAMQETLSATTPAAPVMEAFAEQSAEAADLAVEASAVAPSDVINVITQQVQQSSPVLSFFIGALAAVLLYLLFDYLWKKIQK